MERDFANIILAYFKTSFSVTAGKQNDVYEEDEIDMNSRQKVHSRWLYSSRASAELDLILPNDKKIKNRPLLNLNSERKVGWNTAKHLPRRDFDSAIWWSLIDTFIKSARDRQVRLNGRYKIYFFIAHKELSTQGTKETDKVEDQIN